MERCDSLFGREPCAGRSVLGAPSEDTGDHCHAFWYAKFLESLLRQVNFGRENVIIVDHVQHDNDAPIVGADRDLGEGWNSRTVNDRSPRKIATPSTGRRRSQLGANRSIIAG